MNSKRSKKVYVSHPLRGDFDRQNPDMSVVMDNYIQVSHICREIVKDFPEVLPLSPIHAFTFMRIFEEDAVALAMCLELLELADELWVYGDWKTSEGCNLEIDHARALCMPIHFH